MKEGRTTSRSRRRRGRGCSEEPQPSTAGTTRSRSTRTCWKRTGRWGNSIIRIAGGDEGAPQPRPVNLQAMTFEKETPKTQTIKARKEYENAVAVGGMRNPAQAVGRVPGLRAAGRKVRAAIEEFCASHPDLLRDIISSAGLKQDMVNEMRIDALAEHIGRALGARHHRRGLRSLWRPELVRAFVELADDPDVMLAQWLEVGAPTGVAADIEASGVFPTTEAKGSTHDELWRHWAHLEPRANYASVDDHKQLVREEIDRLRRAGFVTVYPSWAAVREKFGNVVVSKMAALVKEREDGTKKLRLIIDMRRSHVNAHARVHERIVLPRITDMINDALALQSLTESDEELDMTVLDWADAFHSMGVAPAEFPHQIVKGFEGTYIGYETVLFGGAGSPGVWGRAAAFLGRSGQAMFGADEARIQVYVDDPWSIWRGAAEDRARHFGYLLLWWRALGPPVSWRKVQVGRAVKWIGVEIALADGAVKVEMDAMFVSELLRDIENLIDDKTIPTTKLRRIAGKAEWAAGLVPYLRAMVSPLWAALTDTPAGTVGTSRVAHALRWLVAFFRRSKGTVVRQFRHGAVYATRSLTIDVDASPWGYGGVLYLDGRPVEYFAEGISDEDVCRFKIVIGSPRDQALLETLALLIAVRLWKGHIINHEWSTTVRSDSSAALGATCKLRSKDPRMNEVVRELALDLAEGRYELDFLKHVPGVENVLPDRLSRISQPGAIDTIPTELMTVGRAVAQRRDSSWWETADDPKQNDAGRSRKSTYHHWGGVVACCLLLACLPPAALPPLCEI